MNAKFEELVESFIENKVGVSDFFLTGALAALLQEHIHRLNQDGQMKSAGIGNDSVQGLDKQIRSDKIHAF